MNQERIDYYETNVSLLKKHHPLAWEVMQGQDVKPEGEIFFSDEGKVNLRADDDQGASVNLHDPEDPEREVPLFLDMVPEKSTAVIALIGMGLGYTPLALLDQRPNVRHIAVLEPNPGIFAQALKHMDLSPMISDPRLILSVGPDPDMRSVFAPAARALRLEQIHMLQHVPSLTLDNNACQKLYDLSFACANQFNVSALTTFRFGHEFINNRFTHLSSINHNCLLESLQDKFKGVPAIMVAGGPSLDKNVHLLKEAKDRAVIIAADTVLPVLLKQGVVPDFVTSIDPESITYEKFADVIPQIKGVPFLICSAWIHPDVPKLFPSDQVFWSFSANHIEKWLNTLMKGSILTGGAGTVAHMNMIAAIQMGCSPIIFMGQDLAFSEDKDHAGDVSLTNRRVMEGLMNSPDVLEVDGLYGNKVTTSRAYLSLKATFEGMIKSDPGNYINATEGGANIKGTQVKSFQEVLDMYCSDSHEVASRVMSSVRGADIIDPEPFLAEFQSISRTLKKLRKIIKKSDDLSLRIQTKIEKLASSRGKYRSFDALPGALKKQISENDFCHKKIDKENKIWQLLEDITLEGLRQSERLLHEASLIKDDSSRYLDWLSINLKRLDMINRTRMGVLDIFQGNMDRTLEYHSNESRLIAELEKSGDHECKKVDLARFYFENGNYMLTRKLIDSCFPYNNMHEGSGADVQYPEIDFFRGAIAAYQADYEKSEKCFRRALASDFGLEEKIDGFRKQIGDKYFAHGTRSDYDKDVLIALLLKGLRFCSNHGGIRQRLTFLFSEDLKMLQNHLEANTIAEVEDLLISWHERLAGDFSPAHVLDAGMLSDFYRCSGTMFFLKKDLSGAADNFSKALEYAPDNPDLHVQMTEIFFALNEFDSGVAHLNRAVEIDRHYAKYWENIGDNLLKKGQATDAASAYEQCFKAMPEHIEMLKKIGDCYRVMEQFEAASEAYRHYGLKMQAQGDGKK